MATKKYLDLTGLSYFWAALKTALAGKQAKITSAGMLKGDGSGGVSAATAGTDYATPGLLVTGLSLPTSGYSGTGPYTINITATGVATTATKVYELIPVFSATAATRALEKTAWNLIDRATISATNTLALTLTAVPTTAVTFAVKECP